ncbi:hypothetical protein MARPO_0156s0020 [Marchantia polymorpha]|uniref:Uncharacterized protein n=1 Tax=Marchantia polymorpha TaxID=3197 RepID=A0A2R6W4F9_MARPO|nr:hypothetical protein MARPO_0156s0020 [Marchantia polymorpha]|eukprot:PTQ28723.1 hypothetical protein MARPO_0156s0020 [Marchantia polymorpha]
MRNIAVNSTRPRTAETGVPVFFTPAGRLYNDRIIANLTREFKCLRKKARTSVVVVVPRAATRRSANERGGAECPRRGRRREACVDEALHDVKETEQWRPAAPDATAVRPRARPGQCRRKRASGGPTREADAEGGHRREHDCASGPDRTVVDGRTAGARALEARTWSRRNLVAVWGLGKLVVSALRRREEREGSRRAREAARAPGRSKRQAAELERAREGERGGAEREREGPGSERSIGGRGGVVRFLLLLLSNFLSSSRVWGLGKLVVSALRRREEREGSRRAREAARAPGRSKRQAAELERAREGERGGAEREREGPGSERSIGGRGGVVRFLLLLLSNFLSSSRGCEGAGGGGEGEDDCRKAKVEKVEEHFSVR